MAISFLTKGSQVEVSSHEAGSNGAWYSATVICPPPSTTSPNHTTINSLVYVEYHNLLSEDGSSNRLREYANISYVRPAPVSDTSPIDFQLNDLVDAFYRDGWWTGVITAVVDASNFVVTFQNPPDEIQFRCEDLRIHKKWIGGRWIQPQKQDDMALRTTDNQIEQAIPITAKESPVATSIMKRKRQDLDNNDKASPSDDIMKVGSGKKKKHLSDGQSKGSDSEVSGTTEQAVSKTEDLSHGKKVVDTDVGTTDSLIDNQIEQATQIVGKQYPVATSIMEEKTQNNTDSNDETSPSDEIMNADSSTNEKQPTDGQSEDLDFEMTDQDKREKTEMKASTKGSKRKKGGLNKELKGLQASTKGLEVDLFRTRTQEIEAKKDATKNFPLDEKTSSVAKSDTKQPDVPSAALTVFDQEGSEEDAVSVALKRKTKKNSSRKGKRRKRTISVNTEIPAQVSEVSEGASKEKADESLVKDSTTNPEASVGKSSDTMPDDQPIFEENQYPVTISNQQLNVSVEKTVEESTSRASVELFDLGSLPFIRNMALWKTLESMEAFQKLPQKPHFRPLLEGVKEGAREGLAIGAMVTFATAVDQTCSLKFDDPRSTIKDCLETLVELEDNGFEVDVLRQRLTEFLSIKDEHEKLVEQSKWFVKEFEEHNIQDKKLWMKLMK